MWSCQRPSRRLKIEQAAAPADNDYTSVTIPTPASAQAAVLPTNAEIAATVVTRPKDAAAPGVVLAIVATVIIVLGIAGLVTYAYLRTK